MSANVITYYGTRIHEPSETGRALCGADRPASRLMETEAPVDCLRCSAKAAIRALMARHP